MCVCVCTILVSGACQLYDTIEEVDGYSGGGSGINSDACRKIRLLYIAQ